MITKINIRNVASFDEQNHLMEGLGKVNFIFGTNGTGKSTISRVLSQPEADTYSDCVVSWENNVKESVKSSIQISQKRLLVMCLDCLGSLRLAMMKGACIHR